MTLELVEQLSGMTPGEYMNYLTDSLSQMTELLGEEAGIGGLDGLLDGLGPFELDLGGLTQEEIENMSDEELMNMIMGDGAGGLFGGSGLDGGGLGGGGSESPLADLLGGVMSLLT